MSRVSMLGQWADSIRATYHVDPRVFIALVLTTIPPFYVAFAVAVRSALRARRGGIPIWTDRTFVVAVPVVVATWLLPYAYVALFGRLPVWGWVVFLALLCVGAVRLAAAMRHRTSNAPEVTDE
ncbi:MAG: hypothetical protein FDZ75_05390 [Actinobacteria bacterium]|nr:MAG: hypothetical protein FDZ75_05390 [Actinomycetota bacterium]